MLRPNCIVDVMKMTMVKVMKTMVMFMAMMVVMMMMSMKDDIDDDEDDDDDATSQSVQRSPHLIQLTLTSISCMSPKANDKGVKKLLSMADAEVGYLSAMRI